MGRNAFYGLLAACAWGAMALAVVLAASAEKAAAGNELLNAPSNVFLPKNTPSRVFSGGREYVVADHAVVNSTMNKLATFYEANKPAGARLRFGNVEGGNGYIDPLTGDIRISKQLAEKYS